MYKETRKLYKEAIKYLQNLSEDSLLNINYDHSNEIVDHFYNNSIYFNNISDKVNYKNQTIDSMKAAILYDQMYGWNREPLEPEWAVGGNE